MQNVTHEQKSSKEALVTGEGYLKPKETVPRWGSSAFSREDTEVVLPQKTFQTFSNGAKTMKCMALSSFIVYFILPLFYVFLIVVKYTEHKIYYLNQF